MQLRRSFLSSLALFTAMLLMACAQARNLSTDPDGLSEAVRRLQPGDTLTLKPGIYRQKIELYGRRADASHPITITAAVPGTVFIRGSDVISNWTVQGAGIYSSSLATQPSLVFIDGKPLAQLGGTIFNGFPDILVPEYAKLHQNEGGIWPGRRPYQAGEPMPAESFWYDNIRRKLLIRTDSDPRTRLVEASVRDRVFFADGVSHLVLENLVFEHANTSVTTRGGAVVLIGSHTVVRNAVVRNNDLAGLQIKGADNLIENVQAIANGQMGVTARGARNRLVRVDAIGNNTRGFNKWWEAGGFKFIGEGGLQSSELDRCRAIGNHGDGIWFDWDNDNNLVRHSIAAFNTGFGIHYEASRRGFLQDNWVYGNGQRGIYLSDSEASIVQHNLVAGNDLEGIVSVYTKRANDHGGVFGSRDNVVANNLVAWNRNGALILPRGQGAKARGNVYLGSGAATRFSLDFPSLLNRVAPSLREWQALSQQDSDSLSAPVEMPPSLVQALQQRRLVEDWSALRALASRSVAGTQAKTSSSSVAPGPRASTP